MNKPRIIRRSAAATVTGNMVTVVDPTHLTLCGTPANQRPFPVVRSDGTTTKQGTPPRVVRTKRSVNPVLSVIFPPEYDEDTVTTILVEFEMSDYVVAFDADAGCFTACRSDLQTIANVTTTAIKLNADGVTALLDASQYEVKRADHKNHIKLVSFEFDAKRFDNDSVGAWLSENNVDSVQETVENPSNESLTVKRSDEVEGAEVRRMQLEDGVVAVITRSEVADVPGNLVAVVNEGAYGYFGWGMLDFNASMANAQFQSVMDDATYRLRSILDTITLYSELPLDSRKQLVARALTQYNDFVASVMDALPRQVMLLVTRAAENKESTLKDPKATSAAPVVTTAARTDETVATTVAATAVVVDDNAPITRSELPGLIAAAVAAAMVTRTDAAVVVDGAITAGTAAAPAIVATPAADAPITRSDMSAAMAEAMAPILAQVTEMSNTVVLRSDKGDETLGTKTVKRSVFAGAIFGKKSA